MKLAPSLRLPAHCHWPPVTPVSLVADLRAFFGPLQ
jgi:hypothetical protein